MNSVNSPEFSRNLGFISYEEQGILNDSAVAVAGAGGDGGALAIQLARMGVGEIRLADPEVFDIENTNRQACSTSKTVGVNKAEEVGDFISAINPKIDVKVFNQGVTPENLDEFVNGVDLIIDETEFTTHAIGVMVARKAREIKVPNLMAMNVGFGTTVTTYKPDGKSFEEVLGLDTEMSLEEVEKAEVPIENWLPYIPPYVDLDVFAAVAKGEKSAPSVAPGVALAAGTAAVQALLNLVDGANNRPNPVYAPRSLVLDAMSGTSRIIKHPKASFYASYAKVLLNNKLGRVPKADY